MNELDALASRLTEVLNAMDAAGEGMIEDEEVCEVCGEGDGEFEDIVAEFWDATHERSVLAHAECGLNQGWSLA